MEGDRYGPCFASLNKSYNFLGKFLMLNGLEFRMLNVIFLKC